MAISYQLEAFAADEL